MALCRSCQAKIDWVKTTAGKNMPVDPEYYDYDEAEIGMVLVTDGGNIIKVKEGERRPSIKGRISHFSTCPEANNWRRE